MNDKEIFINKHEEAPLMQLDDFTYPVNPYSFYYRSFDNKKLRIAMWNLRSTKGTILLQSGRTEFIEKYYEVIQEFIDRGFAVALMDWRGQGLSDRTIKNKRLGHIDSFNEYDKDIELVLEEVYKKLCPKPWIGFGHSMGGCLLATNLIKNESPYSALILCSPMLSMKVKKWIRFLAKSIALLLPWLRPLPIFPPNWDEEKGWLKESFEKNGLTDDEYRFNRSYKLISSHPKIGVKGISLGWVNEAIKRTEELKLLNWTNVSKPILLLSANKDSLINSDENESLCASIKNITIQRINGKHELLMESNKLREQTWNSIDKFLTKIL